MEFSLKFFLYKKNLNVRSDFPSVGRAGACGTTVSCKGERPACTDGAHSVGIVLLAEMAPGST